MDAEKMAYALADETARADVECYAVPHKVAQGHAYEKACRTGDQDDLARVETAFRYIALRGDALPYRVVWERKLVRFESQ